MLNAAAIIYVIVAVLLGASWPLELLKGKAGPLGYLVLLIWVGLIVGHFLHIN